MVNIVSFVTQNLKWFIIAGIIIGGSIVAYVAYTIYKSTSGSSNKSSDSPMTSASGSASHGGYCNDEMCFAAHSDEHKESFSGSKDSSDDESAEPIESYSSIDDDERDASHDE